jgi:hypothetical protein
MAKDKPLFLYEEIMLLVLRDEQGTVATNEVIAACQTAVMIATMMPVMVSTTVHN